MGDIQEKGLGDVVFEAIPLEVPEYQRVPGNGSVHPEGAILVDLAVLDTGISRVLRQYGTIDFIPLGDNDPFILAQERNAIASKKALGYRKLYRKYFREYRKRLDLAGVLGYELDEVNKAWFNERLQCIWGRLQRLGYC